MINAYALVHIIDIAYSIDRAYSYYIPAEMRQDIRMGSVVVVPFGNANKRVSAVVVGFCRECDFPRVKSVESILNYPFDIPEELIKTCGFMKERFFCTFGSAFRTVLPPGINLDSETVYTVSENAESMTLNDSAEILLREIKQKQIATERELIQKYGEECKRLLKSLLRIGAVEKASRVPEKLNEKNRFTYCITLDTESASELIDSDASLTKKQKDLFELLLHYPHSTLHELEELGNATQAVLNGLIKKGLVQKTETAIMRDAYNFDAVEPEPSFTLTETQQSAVDNLKSMLEVEKPSAALLFGVTGSGKTRVIIETVKNVLKKGKQAIILLPEIGLASQAVRTYAAAFGKKLAVVHSMLSVGERTDTYRRILDGDIRVVLGTRSAVFSPFKNLGIIVIDEEQAHTYKSELTPKYHAVDVARFRCAQSGAMMLLASATPSVESFYKATKGIYKLIRLNGRFGGELPEAVIEDMRDDVALSKEKLLGSRLKKELEITKESGLQSIVFVSRRGYNSHISCRDCGKVFECPNCSVSLTYHAYTGFGKRDKRLSCHYCGYTSPLPQKCTACGGSHIGFFGFGTQKLQDELSNDIPDLTFVRMDSDTTAEKFSHDKILSEFASGGKDVLFGTQMISKGLDFPKVRLAGAVSVDSALYMNDFRAGERAFSLITQLVGRAGRAGGKGIAVLQTFNPDNEILKLAARQDFDGFFESEIKLRKAVTFPPFCSVAVFGISSVDEEKCQRFAQLFNTTILSTYNDFKDVKIIKFGPFPEGIYRILGKFRQRIIIKYKDNARSREFLSVLFSRGLTDAPNGVRLDLDANPSII